VPQTTPDLPETYVFEDDGRIPNSRLPVLVYRQALPADPAAMERRFAANEWSNGWRNGIYPFHHFHWPSTTRWSGTSPGSACRSRIR
jgi:uncharacterized protein YjlB